MKRASLYISHFGLPAAALIFFVEGLGIPIPVELPLVLLGERLGRHPNLYWEMVFLMWSTTVVGNTVGYVMGYFGGRSLALKFLAMFRAREGTWERIEQWFRKHGMKAVVTTRWINWGFSQNVWLCGITRVPPVRFFTIMVINDLLWAMGWTWIAKVGGGFIRASIGPWFRQVAAALHLTPGELGWSLFVFATVVLVLVWWFRQQSDHNGDGPPCDVTDPLD